MNYAIIRRDEIATLSQNKCSGAVWAVYSTLSSHCFKTNSCFPSIKRILELLHHSISERSVYAALQKLERIGLIKRAERTNRERFTLLMKQMVKKVKEVIKPKRRNLQNPAPDCRSSQNKKRRPYGKRKNVDYHQHQKNHKIINKEEVQQELKEKAERERLLKASQPRNHFKSTPFGTELDDGAIWINKLSLYLETGLDCFKPSPPIDNLAAIKALFSDYYPAMKHRDTILKRWGKWLDFDGYEWILK